MPVAPVALGSFSITRPSSPIASVLIEKTVVLDVPETVVRTDNSVYRITILTPHRREVVVQGGTFFPAHTRPVGLEFVMHSRSPVVFNVCDRPMSGLRCLGYINAVLLALLHLAVAAAKLCRPRCCSGTPGIRTNPWRRWRYSSYTESRFRVPVLSPSVSTGVPSFSRMVMWRFASGVPLGYRT